MSKLVVKNTSSLNKAVSIFGLTIYPGVNADVLSLDSVTENTVIDNLEGLDNGELKAKLLNGDLQIVDCDMLFSSGSSEFSEFLVSVGLGNNIKPCFVEEYLTRDNWYIDPVTGNDHAAGNTPGSALKTYAEFQRRVGTKTLTPTELLLNINIMNDLPPSDPITFRNIVGRGHSANISGQEKVLATGTLTGATDKDRSTNTPWQVTDTSVVLSDYIAKKIVITSGQGAGSGAWILRDMGSDTVHVSEWYTEQTFFDGTTFQSEPPATGSTYKVVDYTAVSLGATEVGYEETLGVYQEEFDWWAPVGGLIIQRVHVLNDFDNGTVTTLFPKPMFSSETIGGFAHTIIDNNVIVPPGTFNAGAVNCLFRGTVEVNNGGRLFASGGAYFPGDNADYPALRVETGATLYLGGEASFVGTQQGHADIQVLGEMEFGFLSFWDANHTLFTGPGGLIWGQADDWMGDGSLTDYCLWGTNNGSFPVIFPGSQMTFQQFKFDDGYTPTYPSIEWGSQFPNGVSDGYLAILGSDHGPSYSAGGEVGVVSGVLHFAWAFDAAAGTFSTPRYMTWANMDTAVASGGFLTREDTFFPLGTFVERVSTACDPSLGNRLVFSFAAYVP